MAHKVVTLEEAKAYFKSLWLPMEAKCVLNNLQKILNFLQSPAEEICFVNMQEKYLPFYYMIILDQEFLQTTFLTDECKVVANNILKTLEVNKNSFTWEVSFSTQIAGIPVIFKKVYTQRPQAHPAERYEKPIRLAFKETWINTTLKFIKSSRLVLKYPEMPRREALYLYNGILKLNEEEVGPDSLWAPVWEALNIFKLRFQYIVSIYPTNFDYLKYVHFEKVTLRRRSCAFEIANSIAPLGINEPKLLTDGNSDVKSNAKNINGNVTNLLIPVVNHNDLVKTLLEMNVTKSGTLVYTLKIDGCNLATKEIINEVQKEINQTSGQDNVIDISAPNENAASQSETTIQNMNLNLPDEFADIDLTFVVQGEGNEVKIKDLHSKSAPANANELEFSRETIADNSVSNQKETICSKEVNTSYVDITENKIADIIDIDNVSAVEDFKQAAENHVNCDYIKTKEMESNNCKKNVVIDETDVYENYYTINKNSYTEIDVEESENFSRTHETDSPNSNPLPQRTVKLKKQNRHWFLKEEEFIPADDENELDFIIHDIVLKKKLESINFNDSSEVYRSLMRRFLRSKHLREHPPSAKSLLNRELKIQRRFENKIRRKRRLIQTVPANFIQTSFKAILDFINDETRATMEMVSLNLHECNVLKTLYGFAPDVVPIEEIFDESCLDVAIKLFKRLSEMNEFLEISWIKPSKLQKQTSADSTRRRTVIFTKRPFKKPRKINSKSSKDKHLESLSNPKSILEKMHLIPPINPRLCPGTYEISPAHNRSASVSPARPSMSPAGHKLGQLKSQLQNVENARDKSVRTPTGNLAAKMKTKMLEGLAVPLESDKAMRMMRLMGWNGGALGVRGQGLIEPIQPQLHVPKGVGLGHKMFKSTKLNITKLQRKVHDKYIEEKKAEADRVSNNNSGYTSQSNEDKQNNILSNDNEKDKPKCVIRQKMNAVNKSLDASINTNVVENKNNRSGNEPNSSDSKKMESNDKENQGSSWLTNESLIEKLKNRPNAKEGTKSNKTTNGIERDRSLIVKSIEDKNHETLLRMKNNIEKAKWKVDGDDKLLLYTSESESRHLSDTTQFMVHLLDLCQSDEKSVTSVRYLKKPSQACVIFIDRVIWSLNQRVDLVPPPFSRPGIIMKTCAREVEAHGYMLSYRFNKKLLTLVKTNDMSKVEQLFASPCVVEFEITHHLYEHTLNRLMPEGVKGLVRTKMYINRTILDFVRSGDEERVYYYGRRTGELRTYIMSLISLLNRQMSLYQLGLGNSEHPIFRETLYRMKNYCILYRFDSFEANFSKLQLVKVELERKCRVCQLNNEKTNIVEPTIKSYDVDEDIVVIDEDVLVIDDDVLVIDDDDDVDIYPNRFNDTKSDTTEMDDDLVTDKVNDSIKINSEDTFDDKDYIECDEEYFMGEDWLVYDENNKRTSKNQSDTVIDLDKYVNNSNHIEKLTPNVDCNIESCDISNQLEKNTKENMSCQVMFSDFHKWPKRIKRHENVLDENMNWNTAERYESNFQDFPKRKPNKNVDKETVEDKTLNKTDNIERDTDKTIESYKNKGEIEEEFTNIVDMEEQKVDANIGTLDAIKERDANVAEDEKKNSKTDIVATIENLKVTTLTSDNWPKNILIIHNDPKQRIDANGAKLLQTIISDAIEKYRFLPRIKCYGVKNGGILYMCYDYDSYIWLFDHLQRYNILEYKEEIQTKHKIKMKINTYIDVNVQGIFENIERYYENIRTDSWKFMDIKKFAGYCLLTIKIDDFSLENIMKEGYSLFVGVDKADVSVVYDY